MRQYQPTPRQYHESCSNTATPAHTLNQYQGLHSLLVRGVGHLLGESHGVVHFGAHVGASTVRSVSTGHRTAPYAR
eukprot:3932255-Rhodomonas_salina.1